jgi:hypothetical protein
MAKVRNNIITQGLSGKLGNQIVFRAGRNGQTIVGVKPSDDPNRGLSSSQIAHQDAFRQAITYAKAARENAVYIIKAKGTHLNAYNMAVADWFSKPEVLEIEASGWTGAVGETIRVKAQDDVLVAGVSVAIKNTDGTILEQGEALQSDGLWWTYTTTQVATSFPGVMVVATAQDLAENVSELTYRANQPIS